MGYDRGDSFPFDFEPNGIPFGLKSKGKLSPRSYPIQCERNWKYSFLSVFGSLGNTFQFFITSSGVMHSVVYNILYSYSISFELVAVTLDWKYLSAENCQ